MTQVHQRLSLRFRIERGEGDGSDGGVSHWSCQALHRFQFEVERLWRKWLGRRSWRGRMTWERFARLRNTYPLPPARVVHSVYR